MGCHCSEISKIEHDLEVIGNQLEKISSCINQSRDIDDFLNKSADKLDDNIDVKARGDIISSLKDLNNGQTISLSEWSEECQRYKANLKIKLSLLKSSDHDYHESQKRHNHND